MVGCTTRILAAVTVVCGCAMAQPAASAGSEQEPIASVQDRIPLKVGVYADEGASGIGAIEWFRLVNDSPEMKLKLLDGKAVRGGKVIGFGAGCAVLPEGGIACEPRGGVVEAIKRIFGGKVAEGHCVR